MLDEIIMSEQISTNNIGSNVLNHIKGGAFDDLMADNNDFKEIQTLYEQCLVDDIQFEVNEHHMLQNVFDFIDMVELSAEERIRQ